MLFFPDEKVVLRVEIDNSMSQRNIKSIHCMLVQKVQVKKSYNENVHSISFNLKLVKLESIERQAVGDPQEMVFDLKEIIADMESIKWDPEDNFSQSRVIDKLSSVKKQPSNQFKRSRTFQK